MNSVILVDELDNMLGTMEKMAAHRLGKLHRAFSVFIFNSKGQLLLQQRALNKYHSGGKWTNTCCSHPMPGEKTLDAAHRRLQQEMGLKCELSYAFNFVYSADMSNGISEHEYDHVYAGISDDIPMPDPDEVAAYEYVNINSLAKELKKTPELYTEWLKICFDRVMEYYQTIF
ncbi:MAG TPA: isopentenyl-diphosphate Delta-isomerase [Mucilaginibacter sp.]|nr:isopentenyl-diphosphate Delta-isomerase [Mucilaginibacter sp.]